MSNNQFEIEEITPYRWRLPIGSVPGMRVPGEIIATKDMLPHILSDNAALQVANVATLPGIQRASLAMPDIHWGYGFPIGGVAAFDLDEGVISPGGVGYDINCGVAVLRSNLEVSKVRKKIPDFINAVYDKVPCGVGSEGRIKLSEKDFDFVLEHGAQWLVDKGLADKRDLLHMEEQGGMPGGDPSLVSKRARERAYSQLGTLGSGNHFLELQEVMEIHDKQAADAFGLFRGQLLIMVHSGSRGLGHQVCQDNLKTMQDAVHKYGINLPDRQLACAPYRSEEGQNYLAAMKCAANFAWGNRLAMVGLARQVFGEYFSTTWVDLGLDLVWDVAHNIAKIEKYEIDGKVKDLCVHRKGATRAFGAGNMTLPEDYRAVGQPVLIPGDMGRASYILVGSQESSLLTFGSACHGAGRLMSRKAAIKATKGEDIIKRLAKVGITIRAKDKATVHEEVPEAYKDVTEVVDAVQGAGISRKVARLQPVGTIKG